MLDPDHLTCPECRFPWESEAKAEECAAEDRELQAKQDEAVPITPVR